MAYTNAIFYLDFDLGSDAVRTTISGMVFAQNGTGVRGYKVAHGLVTGSVGTVSGCTQSYANAAWKFTRVDADYVDLDGALWASFNGADVTGDVVPFGGQSWADAWKTITSGATAARIAPGDTIRIAKSPAPYSIGNATWTNNSKTVTLATAQTITVDLCEVEWAEDNSAVTTRDAVATDAKEGSYCMRIAAPASPAANTLYAHYDIYTALGSAVLDVSTKQKLSFWIKNEVALLASQWKLCLCDDTAGTSIVDTFEIPAIPVTGGWVPLTIARTGAGNLGSGIKSIALYSSSNATPPTASKYIRLDCIIACTTSGLNLQSLISKNATEQGGTEPWLAVQSIVGTTVLIDTHPVSSKSNAGYGYGGSTSSSPEASYARETTKVWWDTNGYFFQGVRAGTAASPITYIGGYNISSSAREGETIFDGVYMSFGSNGFRTRYYWNNVSGVSFVRFYDLISFQSDTGYVGYSTLSFPFLGHCVVNRYGSTGAVEPDGGIDLTVGVLYHTTSNTIPAGTKLTCQSYMSNGVEIVTKNRSILSGCTTRNTASGYGVAIPVGGTAILDGVTISESSKVRVTGAFSAEPLWDSGYSLNSINDGGVAGVIKIYRGYGYIDSEATTRHTASGLAWKVSPVNVRRTAYVPLVLSIAKIAVAANAIVTVKAWMKATSGTDIGAKLVCKGGQIAGLAAEVSSSTLESCGTPTDWNELTLTLDKPTAAGVIEIEAQVYWVANTADESVYIDDLTISQA